MKNASSPVTKFYHRHSDRSKSGNIFFYKNCAMENYYALALAVCAKMPSGKALYMMGVAPIGETPKVRSDAEYQYQTIASSTYILHKVCGMMQKDIASLLNVSKATLRRSIAYFKGAAA